ncbi:MAG: hypothetical protein LAP85_19445 [Acidobacteriia bacterium]|nr:hypothetical protein [Terriglobia bacterium]
MQHIAEGLWMVAKHVLSDAGVLFFCVTMLVLLVVGMIDRRQRLFEKHITGMAVAFWLALGIGFLVVTVRAIFGSGSFWKMSGQAEKKI